MVAKCTASVGVGEVAVVAHTEAGGVFGGIWLAGCAVCRQAAGTG